MKLGQLIEHINRNIFLQKLCRNKVGKLVPDLFFFFKKASYEVNASGMQPSFNIF